MTDLVSYFLAIVVNKTLSSELTDGQGMIDEQEPTIRSTKYMTETLLFPTKEFQFRRDFWNVFYLQSSCVFLFHLMFTVVFATSTTSTTSTS